jgi:hypothetical protein
VIGIFSINKEDYECLSDCLALIFDEIEEIEDITIDDRLFKIEKYLGGDLKSLLNLAGINAANSTYGCLWCTCPEHLYNDHNLEWSITDKTKGARSHDEAENLIGTKDSLGYSKPAITGCFPFFRHIIDLLHLRLRITDKLNEYFFEKLLQCSENVRNYKDPINKQIKNPLVGRLNQFLKQECKILRPIVINVNKNNSFNNTYKIRDFRGGDQLKFYEKITLRDQNTEINSIESLFPELNSPENMLLAENIQSLYREFYSIYTSVKTNTTDVDDIKKRTSQWLKLYTSTYFDMRVTPYMHAFGHHLHEFKSLYPNLNDFNQEGHEKFNDVETSYYFRCTNKKEKYINQLLEKFNRVELMNLGFVFR